MTVDPEFGGGSYGTMYLSNLRHSINDRSPMPIYDPAGQGARQHRHSWTYFRLSVA